jgi:AraC-like DNA-binding protein
VIFRADQPYESLVIRVPKHMLGRDEGTICRLTAVGIPGGEGLPRAAVAFFLGLAGGLENSTIGAVDAPNTIECVIDLVRALYAAPAAADGPVRLRTRAEILLNIQSFIETNLSDPELDPDQIARASFISTRYLHKLFEAEGTSVCRWIRTTRLERCRRDLLDPTLADETILSIASRWGLPGPQHFSRLFRLAYGCSPSELRRAARRSEPVAAVR